LRASAGTKIFEVEVLEKISEKKYFRYDDLDLDGGVQVARKSLLLWFNGEKGRFLRKS